jgi:NAD+ synthase
MADSSSIRIAMAQMNPIVGDLAGNAARILMFYEKAAQNGAELVIFPELALVGYPPEDLVLMHSFHDRAMLSLQELAGKTASGPAMLLGTLWEEKGAVFNAAVLLDGGKVAHVQPKSLLPNYGIFDEKRLFTAGQGPKLCSWRGIKLGVLVCEDVWNQDHAHQLAQQGCELMVVINASPFEADKMSQRKGVAGAAVQKAGVPLIYVNTVGGQDDIVFDGGSFALAAGGLQACQAVCFAEALEMVGQPTKGVLRHLVDWMAMDPGARAVRDVVSTMRERDWEPE